VAPFRWVWKVAGSSSPNAPDARENAAIAGIRQAIDRAAARVPHTTCLTRALAGALLLRFAGLPYLMVIGVRKPADGGFSAHAWVLSGSEIVTGDLPDLVSYTPLPIGAARPPGL
jgi:hypothetical protein